MLAEQNSYYCWLISIISHYDYDVSSYQLILEKLFDTEFKAVMHRDNNRIQDGLDLRWKYDSMDRVPFDGPYYLTGLNHSYCSILEMMIALAIRIEDDIMYDEHFGDRTSEWFWTMMQNLDLTEMYDDNYDEYLVDYILSDLIARRYDSNGHGGLFYTNGPDDMRNLEIWYQANHYLKEFIVT